MRHVITLKKILLVSRPISWVNTAYPFAAAYLVSGGREVAFLLIGTLYFLIPYNIVLYGINDIFDYESDIKNPRKGGVEGLRESRALHPAIITVSIMTNVPILFYLFAKSSQSATIALGVIIFFVLAYSIAVLRFKERPILDSITSSIHFVGPMVFGLLSAGWQTGFLPYIIAFFLWGMASHAFGAVQDIIPDRKGNIASIATVLGARATVWIALALYAGASMVLIVTSRYAWPIATTGFIYCANIVPFLQITDATSGRINQAWRRFLWLNYGTGFILTLTLLWYFFAK